jgi:hypothetical protein
MGPMRPISPPLWHACCRQTNYVQNMHGLNTFCILKYSLMCTKWDLMPQPLKGLFSETDLFKKKSRTPVLWSLISFVMSWTQSMTECNAETKQLHPTHLTQGPIAHCYFWESGQARFPALSSSPHSTYSWWGSFKALTVASQWVQHQPEAIAILEPHKNHEWKSDLAGNGLYLRDKASLQRAPLWSAKCAYTEGPMWWIIPASSWEIQPQQWTDTRPPRL